MIAAVVPGTVEQRIGCHGPRVWKAGQSMTEAAPHHVSNLCCSQTPGPAGTERPQQLRAAASPAGGGRGSRTMIR